MSRHQKLFKERQIVSSPVCNEGMKASQVNSHCDEISPSILHACMDPRNRNK